ncbi:MAG: hypothetical protein EOM23_02595, partial [Candidatus Moranbacteria bacterium]|nr:hypothetical protein [Candidatus Moranbacteria bacterium]
GGNRTLTNRLKVYYSTIELKTETMLNKNANLLTVPAANSLLKIIEEPPKYAIIIFIIENINNMLDYYPDIVSQIDSIAKLYRLNYGLSGYWDATHIRLLSKSGIRVYSVHSDFSPLLHNANKNWYLTDNKSRFNNPRFSFIIEGIGLTSHDIIKKFDSNFLIVNSEHKSLYLTNPFLIDSLLKINKHKKVIKDVFCDMETISEDQKFIYSKDKMTKFTNNVVTNKNSFSGRNSLFLSPQENFFLSYEADTAGLYLYEVSAYIKNHFEDVFIFASIKSPKDFYVSNPNPEFVNGKWKLLKLVFEVPETLQNERLSIGVYKPDSSYAYLDDFSIKVFQLSNQ